MVKPKKLSTSNISFPIIILTFLICFEWLIYENLILLESLFFGGKVLLFIINSFKLLFPIILLIYTDLPSVDLWKKTRIKIYIFFFLLFFVWSLVPTVANGDIIVWFKMFPQFLLFISVLVFFNKYPQSFIIFSKFVVIYVIFALLQYFLIIVFDYNDKANMELWGLTGPYGILGNTSSRIYLPGQSYPIIRFCGFWKEPSIASASAFSAFFLARYLSVTEEKSYWNIVSYFCLIAGLLTLSNTGYFALGLALTIGLFLKDKKSIKVKIQLLLMAPLIIIMIWLAFFSRDYFSKYPTENNILLAVSGIRNLDVNSAHYDPSGGRIDLIHEAFEKTKSNFIGEGMQLVGVGGLIAPQGAFMMWLLLTGIPGVFILSVMIITILISSIRLCKNNPSTIFLIQAFIAVLGQELLYGTWMDPKFIILAAIALLGGSSVSLKVANPIRR